LKNDEVTDFPPTDFSVLKMFKLQHQFNKHRWNNPVN